MHTLHTSAASIFQSWAKEQPQEADSNGVCDAETSSLWRRCWCPLLQGQKVLIFLVLYSGFGYGRVLTVAVLYRCLVWLCTDWCWVVQVLHSSVLTGVVLYRFSTVVF